MGLPMTGQSAARFALESRAFPFLTYDPDGGPSFADCLSLDGNPSPNDAWPTYSLKYVDDAGAEQTMELPVTIADWAATEVRFKQHFSETAESGDDMMPFHEFVSAGSEDREGRTPFIWQLTEERRLRRVKVSIEMVALAEERQQFWSQLRQLAGLEIPVAVHDAVSSELTADFEQRAETLRADYESRLAEMKATLSAQIAHRIADGLIRNAGSSAAVAELLASLPKVTKQNGNGAVKAPPSVPGFASPATSPVSRTQAASVDANPASPAVASATASTAVAEDDKLLLDPYIESERCTTCNECTNLNNRMFSYNAEKQAYVKDPKAGTFQQLVTAAERCPVSIIHPGSPLNPKEKDLAKWAKRAEKFN
jgi:hypothetical protein